MFSVRSHDFSRSGKLMSSVRSHDFSRSRAPEGDGRIDDAHCVGRLLRTNLADHILWILALGSFLLTGCLPSRIPDVVKIGLVAPFEGRYRYIGYDAVYAARLAVREVNAAGGIGGAPVELVAYDDRGNVDMAVQAARSLVVDAEVVAVIGHYRDETSAVGAEIYNEANLPYIVLGAYAPLFDTTWHLMPRPASLAEAMVRSAAAPSAAMGAIWGDGPVAAELAALTGSETASTQASPQAEVVYSTLSPVEVGEAMVRWRDRGATGQLIGELGLSAAAFRDVAGESAIGASFVTVYPYPQEVSGISGWITDYLDVGPHVPDPGPYALPTYEAVHLVVDAVRKIVVEGGSPARENVGAGLDAARRVGWLGEIAWDDQRYWRHAPLYTYRWTHDGPQQITLSP